MEPGGRGAGRAPGRHAKIRDSGGSPEDCPVCFTGFDDTVHRPRTLPCGHTVCTLCVDLLKIQNRVACPECRASHAVPYGGHFPVCYTVEALIRRMRDAETPEAAGEEGAPGLSQGMQSFLKEQEAIIVTSITDCWETETQLEQYQTILTHWGERQEQLEKSLLRLVYQSRTVMQLVLREKSRAAAKAEEVKKGKQGLQDMLEALCIPETDQEASAVVAEVFRCTGQAVKEVKDCRECFPDLNTITNARKVKERSTVALTAVHGVEATLETLPDITGEDLRHQSDPDTTIIDRVQLIWRENLKIEDLRSLTQPVRRLLEVGRVYAVHQEEGRRREARISLEADRLYLHALKDHLSPLRMDSLQLREIVPKSLPCMVFLDLSWPGSAPRRVQIRLSPDTLRGRQFLLLCTGQRGPSFVNTRLFKVKRKGEPGEYVRGGDYMSNDGQGASILLPGLDEGEYRKSNRAGDVFGVALTDRVRGESGQFGICTRNCPRGIWSSRVFGEVVEGLPVVSEAARHEDINKVTVVDCGVVL